MRLGSKDKVHVCIVNINTPPCANSNAVVQALIAYTFMQKGF
jgi:hypothetical protein